MFQFQDPYKRSALTDVNRYIFTLPETNIAFETNGWKMNFFSGSRTVGGYVYVSFRKNKYFQCNSLTAQNLTLHNLLVPENRKYEGIPSQKNAKNRSRQWVLFFLWEGPLGDNPTHKLFIPSLKLAPRHFGELTSGYSMPFYKFMEDIRRENHLRMYQTYRCIHGYNGYEILKSNWYMDVFQHHNYSPRNLSFFSTNMQDPHHSSPFKQNQGCILPPSRWITAMQKAAPFVLDIPSFWRPWQVRFFSG